jgi:type I restriction-modification system DNA methylase subunit
VRAASRDVGRALVNAFRAIEAANPNRLAGIFGKALWTDKAQMPDGTLKNPIEHFSQHTLGLKVVPEDELGNAYEYLIKQFADDSGHTAQKFYTNRTVVHLMTQMLEPQAGERIYNCLQTGSGEATDRCADGARAEDPFDRPVPDGDHDRARSGRHRHQVAKYADRGATSFKA